MSSQQTYQYTNLSYVLHERSTSHVVKQYVDKLARDRIRMSRDVERLNALDDTALRERLFVAPGDDPPRAELTAPRLTILSLRVGAWRILPRILRLIGLMESDANLSVCRIDEREGPRMLTLPFFRGPANLCLPSVQPERVQRLAFASAVLRPGNDSILVRCQTLPELLQDDATAVESWQPLLGSAERVVREFVLQWDCERPLWDGPAEATLPEFRT
jgi:hypothetical protein